MEHKKPALKPDELTFSLIVDSSPNAVILSDESGHIGYINRRAEKFFGYSLGELVGKPVETLIPDRFKKAHVALHTQYAKAPVARQMGNGMDLLTAMRKDGSEFPAEIGISPIALASGNWFLVTIADVTDRRQAEDLRNLKEDLTNSDLADIVSHSLRPPLVAINGLAEYMLETKRSNHAVPQQDIDFLQAIADASKNMAEVINGLLDSETIEKHGLTYSPGGVDLSAMCTQLALHHELAAREKGLHLIGNIQPGIQVPGSNARLHEAFEHYLSNAIKYSPPGTTVEVRLTSIAGQMVEYGVKDEGPGLTASDKTKVFGKFQKLSAKPTGGEFSAGLGLFLAKAIIELHKGTVGCESTPGHGAYFWARLPR